MKLKIIRSPSFLLHCPPYMPSLGLSTIYSYLKEKGFDITQEDLNIINHPPEKAKLQLKNKEKLIKIFTNTERVNRYLGGAQDNELENITKKYLKGIKFDDIDILLVSVFRIDFCSSIMALLIARYFKKNFNNKLVIMGGESIQKPYIYKKFEFYNSLGVIDYYIYGFGEEPLDMLLKKIEGAAVSFGDIPGLCYNENGKVKCNNFAGQILTVPNFEGLPLECYKWKPDRFLRKIGGVPSQDANNLILPFQMIYGCYNHCAFCEWSLGTRVYFFKPHEIVSSLKKLSDKHKTKYFFFVNNMVNISKSFINDFCDEIIRNNFKIFWSDCASVRHIDNPEILIKMRKAGACRLIFGLETASPRMLRHIDKEVTPEQASQVFKWTHEAGIWVGIEIIAGLPQEKEEDLQKTLDFLNENIEYIDEIWLGKFYLHETSRMYKFPERYGITNVREINESIKELIITEREIYSYIFDEIDGLKWEEKNEQTSHAFNVFDKFRREKHREPLEIPSRLNVLFYLYTHLGDKSEIRHYYNEYRRLVHLRRLLPKARLPWIIWSQLRKGTLINSLREIAFALKKSK